MFSDNSPNESGNAIFDNKSVTHPITKYHFSSRRFCSLHRFVPMTQHHTSTVSRVSFIHGASRSFSSSCCYKSAETFTSRDSESRKIRRMRDGPRDQLACDRNRTLARALPRGSIAQQRETFSLQPLGNTFGLSR